MILLVSVKQKVIKPKNFLFVDEIQDIEKFEKALRHFQTKKKLGYLYYRQ